MELSPTPRDTLLRDGTAQLYRFRGAANSGSAAAGAAPVLLVPSLINRWYVLDLRRRSSLVEALVAAGHDVFCLDWGGAEDEDRYFGWVDVLARLDRMVRRVLRITGAPRVSLLGYCMGATLATIQAALHPERTASLVNLAGPIDFSHAGLLGTMVDPRWFDAGVLADAGNIGPQQMQSGFTAMRPTLNVAKWVGLADRGFDPEAREAFEALEAWSGDNIPFPGAAYRTYIEELYQKNLLVKGEHHVAGRRVDLKAITCPVLTIVADRDTICPPKAATALNAAVGSPDTEVLTVPGGHVGAVVGSRARDVLYPRMATWLADKTRRAAAAA